MATTVYNPHSPCTLGMEWFPSADLFSWIDSEQNALAFALVADTDDVIDAVWPMVGCWVGSQSVSLEVYDISTGPPPLPALTWQTFYPSIDRYVAPPNWTPGAWGSFNGWNPSAGGLGPMWAALDSPGLTPFSWTLSGQPVDNDQFVFNYFGYGYDFAVGHAGTTGTMAGRWITRIRSHFVMAQYFAYDRPGGITITPYVWVNGRKYFGTARTFAAAQGPVEMTYDWYVNPRTGLPWTPADIDAFDDAYGGSEPNGLGFKMNPTGSSNNLGTILQAQLQVESAATDPRLAMAARTTPANGGKGGTACKQGWMQWALKDPQTAAATTLPLVIGNKYLFVMRKDTSEQNTSFGISTIYEPGSPEPLTRSLDTLGPPFWTQYTGPTGFGEGKRHDNKGKGVRLDGGSRRVIDLGIETGLTPGIALHKSGGGMSKDSQPYASTSPLDGADPWPDLGEWFNNSPINSSRWMQQEFTAIVNDDYGWIWIMVAQVAGSTDGDLEIRVRRRSDDVQMGGTATITSEDLAPPRHSWQRIGVRLPGVAPTLLAGVQYYLDITSTASEDQGWLVQAANSGYEPNPYGPPNGTNAAAGWGNGVDKLTFGDPMMDQFGWTAPDAPGSVVACISISTIPEPPDDFVAVAAGQTCCIDYIQLSWTPVLVDCGEFAAYEIQRDDGDGTWRTIAYITDELVTAFDDYESKANTEAFYRARLIRDDGAPSDWTATASATAAMAGCCGIVFTSNESPDLTVFYQDLEEQREFQFPSFEQVFAPHDRDYQIVFRELEDRGSTFKASLRVRAGHMPCGPGCDDSTGIGVDVFDPLKAIARAGLSYVCVKNESGNRWFAYVRTPTGQWRQHGSERSGGFAAYMMDVEVVEVTNVPSRPDSTAGGS